MINKHGLFIDYGDAVNLLVETFSCSSEMAFYFYEDCENNGLFDECRSSEEVDKILIEVGENEVWEWL